MFADLGLFDILCLGVALLSCLIGMWRGFAFEVLSLAAWAGAFFAAQWGSVMIEPESSIAQDGAIPNPSKDEMTDHTDHAEFDLINKHPEKYVKYSNAYIIKNIEAAKLAQRQEQVETSEAYDEAQNAAADAVAAAEDTTAYEDY